MKKIVCALLLAACVLPCAKAQFLGPGVSVDAEGNLKIDAPVYVMDKNPQKPGLKPAPASMNRPVYASIHSGEIDSFLEVTGGIVNGRLSVTIPSEVTEVGYGAFAGCEALSPALKAEIEKRFGWEVFYRGESP